MAHLPVYFFYQFVVVDVVLDSSRRLGPTQSFLFVRPRTESREGRRGQTCLSNPTVTVLRTRGSYVVNFPCVSKVICQPSFTIMVRDDLLYFTEDLLCSLKVVSKDYGLFCRVP